MSLVEMQSLLGRLYVDTYCRRLFRHDPDVVLRDYRLTPTEREAIVSIEWDRVEQHAAELCKQRLHRFRRLFPLLFRMGDATETNEVERLTRRFHGLHPSVAEIDGTVELQMFALFIRQSLTSNDAVPAYAPDVSRYDYVRHRVASGPPRSAFPETRPNPSSDSGDDLDDTAILEIAPATQVVSFDYDVVEIARALRSGNAIDAPDKTETMIVLQNRDGTLRTLRPSGPTAALLARIDGRSTIGDVVDAVEDHYGRIDLYDAIWNVVAQMRAETIVQVRPQPSA